jgi:hypothetical protein
MANLLIAIVGDLSPSRTFEPVLKDSDAAKKAANQLGAELANQGARLLVYGGPFLEMDVIKGYVEAKPKNDASIIMWYTVGNEPPPFPEESTNPRLFKRVNERGVDWEVAFYRSITRADGIILMGGGNATKISGQVAIGSRMPIVSLKQFGGGAAKVWETFSAGEDLPKRAEIDLMATPWNGESAANCVKALFDQYARKQYDKGESKPALIAVGGLLFILALAIVPWIFGGNELAVWMLFVVPLLAGGAGAVIRQVVDHLRGSTLPTTAMLATIVLGLVAGGIAGVLFITAQLTADPKIATSTELVAYARHSIPFTLGIGFVAGLTSDAVFGKLLGLDVVKTTAIASASGKS